MNISQNKQTKCIGFAVNEVTFLKYFIPLAEYASKRGTKVIFFSFSEKAKLTSPMQDYNQYHLHKLDHFEQICYDNPDHLIQLCREKEPDLLFTIEGIPFYHREKPKDLKTKIIAFTYMTDITAIYSWYRKFVDKIIVPGKWLLNYIDDIDLNQFSIFGLPKYDYLSSLNAQQIRQKYKLGGKKIVLLFAPIKKDLIKCFLTMYKFKRFAKKNNYSLVIKTRYKHKSFLLNLLSNKVLYDVDFYPSTSLELIESCDFAVTFDSTAIKELILQRKPFINFNIIPYKDEWWPLMRKHMFHKIAKYSFLHDTKSLKISVRKIESLVKRFNNSDLSEFESIQEEFFYIPEENKSCKAIYENIIQDESVEEARSFKSPIEFSNLNG